MNDELTKEEIIEIMEGLKDIIDKCADEDLERGYYIMLDVLKNTKPEDYIRKGFWVPYRNGLTRRCSRCKCEVFNELINNLPKKCPRCLALMEEIK